MAKCKVVGTTFQTFNPSHINRNLELTEGAKTVFGTYFQLKREPENPFDTNAVAVYASIAGKFTKIGYIPKEIAAESHFEDVAVHCGDVLDYSNGRMKNVSYKVYL